jgi:hypothetical protein
MFQTEFTAINEIYIVTTYFYIKAVFLEIWKTNMTFW